MCVSLAPAHFSKTTLYVGEAQREGQTVHVLGYQNTAQNLAPGLQPSSTARGGRADDFWETIDDELPGQTGNAMILPFPAAAEMTEANVVDTDGCKRILKDMVEAIEDDMPRTLGVSAKRTVTNSLSVFDTGIYTVVLASDPTLIPSAIERVPEAKRPPLTASIFEVYAEWYPGCPVALCCFNNSEAVEADPLLWWYEPKYETRLFAPALDSHSGNVPNLDADVEVDHAIIVGSYRIDGERAHKVNYRDTLPDATRELLPDRVLGGKIHTRMHNGDFGFHLAEVLKGEFHPLRIPPPGARR